jgi:membrane fusion protein, multidrug efflux system
MNAMRVVLALSFGLAACGGRATSTAAAPPAGPVSVVRTAAVVRTGGSGEIAVAGAVRARERAALAARVSASVIQLPYQEGERVPAGAVVVRLDDAAARAVVASAEASAGAAESDLDRARTLFDAGAGTRRDLERASAGASAARAQLAAARDGVSYSALRAPFAGRLSARRVHLGDVVTPGALLVEVEGEGGLELVATVEPGVAATLRPGAKLKALVDGQPGPLAATVTAIAPSGDTTTHRVELTADLPEAPGLRAGLFARLLVPGTSGESRLSVPATALLERGGLTGLFVVDGGQARLRWAAVGLREGDVVEIRAGVDPGERVVVDPAGLVDRSAVVERRE